MLFSGEMVMMNMNLNHESSGAPPDLPISLIPFAIQLQNVVPIEISAKRFPVNLVPDTPLNSEINIVGLYIDPDNRQAQIILETKIEPINDPKPFEIILKVVGLFTYSDRYSPDDVQKYLQAGSISVLLPFIRESIFQLSMRLQISPIMLPLIQLADPTNTEEHSE